MLTKESLLYSYMNKIISVNAKDVMRISSILRSISVSGYLVVELGELPDECFQILHDS